MERFRDQGEEMCELATSLLQSGRQHEAAEYYQRACDLGSAHGFFSVESRAFLGLGVLATGEGRAEEGLDLLRNALAAARLAENEASSFDELFVLYWLINALFEADAIEEVEKLVLRYGEMAEEKARKERRLCWEVLRSHVYTARLHEVLCTWTHVGNHCTMFGPCIPPRPKASALVPPCSSGYTPTHPC
jgi:tetratricopeptide (TPR) repeat protein